MYSLIIVDDEELARDAFKALISNSFSDIEIVGEAANGRKAIEISRELKPDIIVMDIKMPGINGIDASQTIINELPDTKILMLTAYDNFNYVQQAIDIGVSGYLLKPLKNEEVITKINKVIKDIENKRSRVDINKEVEQKIGEITPYIQKELISAFISGTAANDEVKSYINFLQQKIDMGFFMLISPQQDQLVNIDDSMESTIYDELMAVVKNHLPSMRQCIFGKSIGNVITVLFPLEEASSKDSIIKESIAIAQEIKRKVKVIVNLDIAIGIGDVHSTMQNIKQSYDEAKLALKKAIMDKDIVHYNDISKYCEDGVEPKYPIKLESDFLEQLRIGNINKAKNIGEEIISQIFNSNFSTATIKEYISELITILKRNALQIGVDSNLIKDVGILLELNGITKADEMEIWIKNSIFTIVEYIGDLKNQKESSIMTTIYKFIDRQFYKDITLEMAAEQVGFSPQYFSKIFKENYGMNFIEYITDKRMKYAQELLKADTKSIKEISRQVGYEDVNYFSRIFKKNIGLTPNQYRNKVKGEI